MVIERNEIHNPRKWKVGWGITARCNMSCAFCYSKSTRVNMQGLTFKELTDFVHRNAPYIDSINYGTGENTLSEEWFQLVDYV